jgi:hypothetical protein
MPAPDTESAEKKKDRKLGDEWADWSGDPASFDAEIDETRSTFFALAALALFVFVGLIALSWYLIKPRFQQFSPLLPDVIQWGLILLAAISLVLALIEGFFVVKLGRSLFPYKLMQRVILSILPKAIWLGGKFGISRDRVGNSFIKVHNLIIKSYSKRLSAERVLILLPRCLKREARARITDRIDGNTKVLTVAGGEEAREAIKQYRPDFILAIACERDLMSGIKDVAEKIPVLAIANKRPEGPCKNTDFSSGELDEAFRFIAARRNEQIRIHGGQI